MILRHVIGQSFGRAGEALEALAERGRSGRHLDRFHLNASAFTQRGVAFEHDDAAFDGSIVFHRFFTTNGAGNEYAVPVGVTTPNRAHCTVTAVSRPRQHGVGNHASEAEG